MSASVQPDTPPSLAFIERFHARASASELALDREKNSSPPAEAILRFDEFMDLALYDPVVGYYRQERVRVGRSPGTDFYTATTTGSLFGELVCVACAALLPGQDLGKMEFVEIGAEPGAGILREVKHPFRAIRTLRVGEALAVQDHCVIFSNELFDAQPFRRWVRREGAWREIGVSLQKTKGISDAFGLEEILLPATPANTLSDVLKNRGRDALVEEVPEGYCLDLPLAAGTLAESIAQQPWSGLFLAFDYGKTWTEISHAQPAGTARAYFQHRQSNDLLARPGQQDLTCHVVWDWLEESLRVNGFRDPQVESQEAFFVHHSGELIARVMAEEASRVSQRKLGLMQLLHPAHLGQKFQALHAVRK